MAPVAAVVARISLTELPVGGSERSNYYRRVVMAGLIFTVFVALSICPPLPCEPGVQLSTVGAPCWGMGPTIDCEVATLSYSTVQRSASTAGWSDRLARGDHRFAYLSRLAAAQPLRLPGLLVQSSSWLNFLNCLVVRLSAF